MMIYFLHEIAVFKYRKYCAAMGKMNKAICVELIYSLYVIFGLAIP